jgi:DNA polymerase-3 subunit alpha
MAAPDFVHLHVHSEYSLLDGANRIDDLVAACVKDGQRALALTDHGNLFGAIELYKKCRAAGIRPLLGCEVYVAVRSRLEPHSKQDNRYHHLTLIARDREGWANLMRMASAAFVEGYSTRPRIDKAYLAQHARGITCLSGCLAGEIDQLLVRGEEARAERAAVELRDLFGADHFWLELQENGIEHQRRANAGLARIAQRTAIPLVATNDIHYLRREDCAAQDVLLCINTGAKRSDEKRFRFDTETLYFRTRQEMAEIFADRPEALTETMRVAEQVELEIEFGKYRVPVFRTGTEETPEELFERVCDQGLRRTYGEDDSRARERLEREKKVIREMGFVSYFLIVWDLVRWAREHGIPVGPGRGSAAGSIVAYVLGITKIDPLRYDLLFERFLNSARISMPDIDIDFCKEGRERVLQYTRERYGAENVAQIVTFGTLSSRTVVRDVGRALDLPLKEIDAIAKRIPAGPQAPSLAEALEKDPDLRAFKAARPELAELFDFSVALEGIARHTSTHAAGVVIADRPLTDYVPLCIAREESGAHRKDLAFQVATQWPAPQLEELGLVKMDYLGLRTLTILERTLRLIERSGRTPPDLDRLPEGDPATYALLASGDTLAVFQLESEGMRKLLTRLAPDRFEDLIAVLALYRPGPLESGMIDMFIRRKHGEERTSYAHPSLEPILADTYGCIVYQEQVMLISSALGGFSLNEADNLRKAMGKKKPEIMEKFAAQFVAGAVANGCAEGAAREIWEQIVKFGGYGFNKSHSTAYAAITYQTAFLKANHRAEFLAANLSCEMESSEKVKALIDDAKRARIDVLGPDVARSGWGFEPEQRAIRYGLGAIKGTGEKAIAALIAARERLARRGVPAAFDQLARECDPLEVPKTCWEALIKAGAFDSSARERGELAAALESALAESARAAADRRAGQGALFGAPSAPASPRSPARDVGVPRWNRAETLRAEREVLGFYFSGHPLEERAGLYALLSTAKTSELALRGAGAEVAIAGLIVSVATTLVKSGTYAGRKMARLRLEDLEGGVSVTCFPRAYDQAKELLVEDAVVLVRGKIEERAEEPALILEEATTIDDALRRFEGGLLVDVEPGDAPALAALQDELKRHPGKRPVYFRVRGADGRRWRVRAGPAWRVDLSSALAERVDRILGRGRVRLARI